VIERAACTAGWVVWASALKPGRACHRRTARRVEHRMRSPDEKLDKE
jgi:hypothetical protein